MNMDLVFKALADPTRRGLLDELFKQDGQTLWALEHGLAMTRFGVMKHKWVSDHAEPWVATLSELKQEMEEDHMEKIFEIYIKTTPERLWEAITSTEMRTAIQLWSGRQIRLDARLPLRNDAPQGAGSPQRGREPRG